MIALLRFVAELLASGLTVLVAAMFAWHAIRGLWGLRSPAPRPPRYDRSFGVLVPAHDEAGAMQGLFDSLARVDYPRERLRVLFVADHCSDATAAEVRAAGFECLERSSGERGKTASLAAGLAELRSGAGTALDAIAIFDADNVVDAAFFAQACAALAEGHAIVQGRVGVHNWLRTRFARINYMNAVVENRLEELARSQAGMSCNLRGHGMVFRIDVADQLPWRSDTLVEDQEMLVRLVLAGRRVEWAEHARVASVLPETTAAAAAQRRRWAGGRSAIVGRSVSALWTRAIAARDPVALHLMIDFLMPSHAVQLSLLPVAALLGALGAGPGSWQCLLPLALLPAWVAYFMAGNLLSGVPARTFLDVLWAPFFIAWRTWIFLSSSHAKGKWR